MRVVQQTLSKKIPVKNDDIKILPVIIIVPTIMYKDVMFLLKNNWIG